MSTTPSLTMSTLRTRSRAGPSIGILHARQEPEFARHRIAPQQRSYRVREDGLDDRDS